MNRSSVGIGLLRGIIAAALLVGCGDSVVGGRCLPGYVALEGGGCERVDETTDGAVADAAVAVPEDGDNTGDDAAVAVPTDGGSTGDDAAAPIDDAATVTDAPADPDAGADTGEDAPLCPADLAYCDGRCVDLASDEDHCGACGVVCEFGYCIEGVCGESRTGHLVVIGHNMAEGRDDQRRLLANAVFLSAARRVRVLAFEGRADVAPGGLVERANAALDLEAGERLVERTAASDAEAFASELSLERFDVALVYEQTHATDAQIAADASALGPALAAFARSGGTVVILDGSTRNAGTYPIANATGLVSLRVRGAIDGESVTLADPSDAMAVGVSPTFRARTTSVRYDMPAAHAAYAVFTSDGQPVVIHRAFVAQ